MWRRILRLGAAAALLAGAGIWLWPRAQPHVLLITLDTTRADRLGCYGYSAADTPVLDSLAAEGVLCERAFTVAPITLPSHAAMFTGLHPAENGVVTNGRGRLGDGISTLAEVLKRQGYDTGAFVASFVLNRKFGLDRGFRTYDDEFADEETASDALHRQRHGESVVDAALEWLGAKRTQPFFCWVHLYDPHEPYLPHNDLFQDKYAERPYDGEIAYVDRQVGRLVDFLKTRGLETQTLVVVVGDHGEGLQDHVERTHGLTLYGETLHVPLIFRQLGQLPGPRRVAGNVSLVDLSPTILDLLGQKERRKITGKSLKTVLAGDDTPGPIYSATDDPFLNNGWSPLRSLIDGQWKYIRTTRPELYDLAADPHEKSNLVAAEPARAVNMESRMVEFESRLERRAAVAVHLTARERQALEALGYLGGRANVPAGQAPVNLPDVKDMLPFEVAVEDAVKLAEAGSPNEAIEQLRDVMRKAPGHTEAYWYLAGVLRDTSQLDAAEKVLRDQLAVTPDSSKAHYALGAVLLQQEKSAEALVEFQETIDIDPENVEAHYNLARLLVKDRQAAIALAHFNTALELDPQHIGAYQWRALQLLSLGRTAEAIADYRAALKYSPNVGEAHHNLGVLLADHGEAEEALRHISRAVELNPGNAQFQLSLGNLFARERQYQDAARHLAIALEIEPGLPEAQERMRQVRQALTGRQGDGERGRQQDGRRGDKERGRQGEKQAR